MIEFCIEFICEINFYFSLDVEMDIFLFEEMKDVFKSKLILVWFSYDVIIKDVIDLFKKFGFKGFDVI